MNNVTRIAEPSDLLAKAAMVEGYWANEEIARDWEASTIRATWQQFETSLKTPLAHLEPKLDGTWTGKVKGHLNTIMAAMLPTQSPDITQTWVNAMCLKLSNLPAAILVRATRKALHESYQFPPEVEQGIRDQAETQTERYQLAIARLKQAYARKAAMLADRQLLANPNRDKPMEELEPHMPTDEVHKLQRSPDPFHILPVIIRMGLRLGSISPDQLLKPGPGVIDHTENGTKTFA